MDILETAVTDCTFRSSPGLVMCEVHSLKRLGSGSEPWCPHAHKGKELTPCSVPRCYARDSGRWMCIVTWDIFRLHWEYQDITLPSVED